MARFIDLEVNDNRGDTLDPSSSGCSAAPPSDAAVESVTTPTVCNAVTRAFQCYPIVVGVVSHIDLTTLDSLARASRMIHHGLVQYRVALLAATLRCSNENLPLDAVARANAGIDSYTDTSRHAAGTAKTSRCCARDMNCATKPPAASTLRERHRRLCAACAKAPLEQVACPGLDPARPGSADTMQRSLCDCAKGGVWLCQPCGRTIRNADHDYLRIWRWRNHYGEVLGCLGTGIGDADRGVICGREERCLAARECEQEIDCDAEDARSSRASSTSSSSDHHQNNNPATPPGAHNHGSYFPASWSSESRADERSPSSPLLLGPGYERHEIEGIGGIVKRKLVRMVRVGKCVPEWEEERTSARVLGREARGEARSWCGWCWRVVPGRDDPRPADKLSAVPSRSLAQTAVEAAAQQSRPPPTPAVCPPAGS
ncbi:hypothetical protein BBO_00899 [Beauveria brongniartii RCEF 3172]|uniref:Sulfate transporter protein n=1 Tax=Beauveria brongniartii RCEF 3172 TaxID=1081107 RepID=A0A167JY63_9HYPO|nr:hypothetical protein BBO_00899 [Beauveria brongniartii RCEF 3172]